MGIGDRNGPAERLAAVLDHYMDVGLRDEAGSVAVWPCPSCGKASFFARLDEGVAGCTDERCGVSPTMDVLDLVAYLDDRLEPGDRPGAHRVFEEVLEEAVRGERERERELEARRRKLREERRWRKKAGGGPSSGRLF